MLDDDVMVLCLVDLVFGYQPTAQNPVRDVRQFIQEFESEYGARHLPFLISSYEQVNGMEISNLADGHLSFSLPIRLFHELGRISGFY